MFEILILIASNKHFSISSMPLLGIIRIGAGGMNGQLNLIHCMHVHVDSFA